MKTTTTCPVPIRPLAAALLGFYRESPAAPASAVAAHFGVNPRSVNRSDRELVDASLIRIDRLGIRRGERLITVLCDGQSSVASRHSRDSCEPRRSPDLPPDPPLSTPTTPTPLNPGPSRGVYGCTPLIAPPGCTPADKRAGGAPLHRVPDAAGVDEDVLRFDPDADLADFVAAGMWLRWSQEWAGRRPRSYVRQMLARFLAEGWQPGRLRLAIEAGDWKPDRPDPTQRRRRRGATDTPIAPAAAPPVEPPRPPVPATTPVPAPAEEGTPRSPNEVGRLVKAAESDGVHGVATEHQRQSERERRRREELAKLAVIMAAERRAADDARLAERVREQHLQRQKELAGPNAEGATVPRDLPAAAASG